MIFVKMLFIFYSSMVLYLPLAHTQMRPPYGITMFVEFNMFTTDVYNEKSSLLYSGKSLKLVCNVDSSDENEFRNRDKNVLAKGQTTDIILKDETLAEQYFCYDVESRKTSHAFRLKYLLCNDGGEVCNKMDCPESEGNRFCVMNKTNTSPATCQLLPKACDGEEEQDKFGYNVVGRACVKNDTNETNEAKSLCSAFAENQPVMFLTYNNKTCKEHNVTIGIPDLKKNVSVGFIGQLGSSIEFQCQPGGCQLSCTEKSPNETIFQNSHVTETYELSPSNVSAITKIICRANVHGAAEYYLYLYNVRINAEIQFVNVTQAGNFPSFQCAFVNDVDDLDGRIKRSIKVTFMESGTKMNETFFIDYCGRYVCDVTVKVRQCNPFFETSLSNSSTMIVTENCEIYIAPTSKPEVKVTGGTREDSTSASVNGKLVDTFVMSSNIVLSTAYMFHFLY